MPKHRMVEFTVTHLQIGSYEVVKIMIRKISTNLEHAGYTVK